MIRRKYGNRPALYLPDVGEVVLARRSAVDVFVKAVILGIDQRRDGDLKIKVQWLGDDPKAGIAGLPIKAGSVGWVVAKPGGWPPMIKQITKDQPG